MKFRLVDRIAAWTPYESIRGSKAVSFEEYCLKERWGDEPRLPETLALESFLQLGNWLVLLSTDFQKFALVTRIGEVQFLGPVGPGSRLEMELRVVRHHDEGWELAGEGRVDGQTVMRGSGCLAFSVPVAEFVDPADLRVLFSKIHQPVAANAP